MFARVVPLQVGYTRVVGQGTRVTTLTMERGKRSADPRVQPFAGDFVSRLAPAVFVSLSLSLWASLSEAENALEIRIIAYCVRQTNTRQRAANKEHTTTDFPVRSCGRHAFSLYAAPLVRLPSSPTIRHIYLISVLFLSAHLRIAWQSRLINAQGRTNIISRIEGGGEGGQGGN